MLRAQSEAAAACKLSIRTVVVYASFIIELSVPQLVMRTYTLDPLERPTALSPCPTCPSESEVSECLPNGPVGSRYALSLRQWIDTVTRDVLFSFHRYTISVRRDTDPI